MQKNCGIDEHRLALLSILGAFIFAAQMVNFPVSKGTSGHLLGAALATLMLGPWYSMLILSIVLIVQLLFYKSPARMPPIFNRGMNGGLFFLSGCAIS